MEHDSFLPSSQSHFSENVCIANEEIDKKPTERANHQMLLSVKYFTHTNESVAMSARNVIIDTKVHNSSVKFVDRPSKILLVFDCGLKLVFFE